MKLDLFFAKDTPLSGAMRNTGEVLATFDVETVNEDHVPKVRRMLADGRLDLRRAIEPIETEAPADDDPPAVRVFKNKTAPQRQDLVEGDRWEPEDGAPHVYDGQTWVEAN